MTYATVKTAISLEAPLFAQVESLAEELNISRSHLFVMAMEEFIERHQKQQMLAQLNAVYDEEDPALTKEEEVLRQKMRRTHKRLVEGEW